MKKLNIYLMAGLITLTAITSCKKINSLDPHDQIDLNTAFQTVKDAAAWDAGTYASFRGYKSFASSIIDIQADQMNISLSEGNNNANQYKWGAFLSNSDVSGLWVNSYSYIANINVAIAGFKNIKTNNDADAAKLKQYTGDLYLARAFYYHALILRYAKPFEPATAATDPGVPDVTVYNINAQPDRSTVKNVYDQIISDITTAESMLAGVTGSQGAQNFNIDVATALEARVRLHMHDWAGAYAAANKLISAGTYPLINKLAAFQDYWYNDSSQEDIYQPFVNSSNEQASSYLAYLNFGTGTNAYNPSYIPSQWVIDMYQDGDIRKATYFTQYPVNMNGIKANLYLINKYPGNPALNPGGTVSNYENAPKTVRVAEMYLIAAEAAANNSNPAAALTALNLLRSARGIGNVTVLSGDALTQAIRDERFRELAFEGFRLDDLKRWHLGFTRRAPQDVNVLLTGTGTISLNIAADDNKFVWGLPSNDLTLNPNLKPQNPGW